jgi:hypothetical protein
MQQHGKFAGPDRLGFASSSPRHAGRARNPRTVQHTENEQFSERLNPRTRVRSRTLILRVVKQLLPTMQTETSLRTEPGWPEIEMPVIVAMP